MSFGGNVTYCTLSSFKKWKFSSINFWYSSAGHSKGVCGMRSATQTTQPGFLAMLFASAVLFPSSDCAAFSYWVTGRALLWVVYSTVPTGPQDSPCGPTLHLHTEVPRGHWPSRLKRQVSGASELSVHLDQYLTHCTRVPLNSLMLLRSYAFWKMKKKKKESWL